MDIISMKDVSKYFSDKKVLDNINFKVKSGEKICIIGPSGSGKTMLLRTLNKLEPIQEGSIYIFGKNIHDNSVSTSQLCQEVGMVFQNFNLFNHLTVIENIIISPIKLGIMSKKEAKNRAMELLSSVGLKNKADSMPNQLSGGEKQRVAIARTLAMSPKIILFDEPTSALDPEMVSEVLDIILKLAKQDITMLIVTHEMDFVEHIASRVVFMEKGKIISQGTVKEIFTNTKSDRVKKFLNSVAFSSK